MGRLRETDLMRVLEVVHELDRAPDLAALRTGAMAALLDLIPSDQAKFEEVDLRTGDISALTDPTLPEWSERLEAATPFADQHPAVRSLLAGHDPSPWRMSDYLTVSEFRQLELHDILFRPYGIDYQLGSSLRVAAPLLIVVCLNRRSRDFTDRERDLLGLSRDHLARAFENASLRELVRSLGSAEEGGARGAVLVTPQGRIQSAIGAAEELLARYFEDAGSDHRLPREIEVWLAGRLADANGTGNEGAPRPAEPLVVEGANGDRLAVRLIPGSWSGDPGTLLVEESRETLSDAALTARGLTRRELDVLRLVVRGLTNDGIAYELSISPRTVHKHLERVFNKLGVGTRTAAATRALELSSAPEA